MKWIHGYSGVRIATFAFALYGLGGCIEYQLETTLYPDGSGVRYEEMMVEQTEELEWVSPDEFQTLMHVTGSEGWSYELQTEEDDTVQVFRRGTRVKDLASWAALSGALHISGATTVGARSSLAHVSLGDVHFLNIVRVETGHVAGGSSFTYRETFYWENLNDAMIEHLLTDVRNTLDAQYPGLTSEQRGEIIGLVRGGLWAAVDRGLFDASGDRQEEIVSAFVKRTAEQAQRVVRQRYPEVDEEFFENMLRQVYEDEDRLMAFIEGQLPGVQLAASTEIVFRLNMPGRVTTSNAHGRDGTTLVWEFAPGDATTTPIEIFAESVVER